MRPQIAKMKLSIVLPLRSGRGYGFGLGDDRVDAGDVGSVFERWVGERDNQLARAHSFIPLIVDLTYDGVAVEFEGRQKLGFEFCQAAHMFLGRWCVPVHDVP